MNANASIVLNRDFENSIVQLQRGNYNFLSREEESVVASLLLDYNLQIPMPETVLLFAERAFKRWRCIEIDTWYKCMYTRFLLRTFNICKLLFSTPGFAYSNKRKKLHPSNLVSHLFLHFNHDLWSCVDVTKLTLQWLALPLGINLDLVDFVASREHSAKYIYPLRSVAKTAVDIFFGISAIAKKALQLRVYEVEDLHFVVCSLQKVRTSARNFKLQTIISSNNFGYFEKTTAFL